MAYRCLWNGKQKFLLEDEGESHDPQTVLEIWDSPSENLKGSLPGIRQMKMKGLMMKTIIFLSYMDLSKTNLKMQALLLRWKNSLDLECEKFFLVTYTICFI